jgi:Holliday junction resolvase-like predicted endonuclease
MWKSDHVSRDESMTVWDRLRQYAATQSGPFTSQETLSWFRRHAPSQANDRTVRTHIRGACWNVGDRSQFSNKEPFLTRIDRGVFRVAAPDEIGNWRAGVASEATVDEGGRPPSQIPERVEPTRLNSPDAPPDAEFAERAGPSHEWHTEANVQALLVSALVVDGWRILSVANTATKEHGIDVIATRDGQTVGIEVKGFPSRVYADPSRAGEKKRSAPSTQAGHWFSQAVLAAMRLRGKESAWQSVIALPDFPRYRALHSETVGSLDAAGIKVWWVEQTGIVRQH